MPNNMLLTGKPASGKTTLVIKLVDRLAASGFKAAGFVTEEIREGPNRAGFRIRDLGGDSAVLAHITYKGKYRVGKYGVDIEEFERIALRALRIEKKEADLLVVDEIGRMELASQTFRSTLLELLDATEPLLATVHAGRDAFTEEIISREDALVFHLVPSERDSLLEVIDDSMRDVLTDRRLSVES
jgi:nucleoside-triphosphatase